MKKLEYFEEKDYADNKVFCALVREYMHYAHLTNKDVAHEFGICLPTIQRWREDISAPHPAMRKHVIDWLEKKAHMRLFKCDFSKLDV